MNLPVIALVGVLAFAAPAGYLTLTATPADATGVDPVDPAELAADGAGLLRTRVRHDGGAIGATLRIVGPDGGVVLERGLTLASERDTVVDLAVPVGVYAVDLAVRDGGFLFARFEATGSVSDLDLAACAGNAADVLFHTFVTASQQGIRVPGPACLDEPTRHVALQHVGAEVVVPYPTCPTRCAMGYEIPGDRGLELDVAEAGSTIRAAARWEPETPNPTGFRLVLALKDGCGENCWQGVASAPLTGDARIEHAAAVAGTYLLFALQDGTAGVKVNEHVWLMATLAAP